MKQELRGQREEIKNPGSYSEILTQNKQVENKT